MPATLQFFDMSVNMTPPAFAVPVAITTGPNFQPNDIRLVLQWAAIAGNSTFDQSLTPPGYTDFYVNTSGTFPIGMRLSYRRMLAGDTDTFIQYVNGPVFDFAFVIVQVTVRGVSPSAAPVPQASATILTLPSLSTTG